MFFVIYKQYDDSLVCAEFKHQDQARGFARDWLESTGHQSLVLDLNGVFKLRNLTGELILKHHKDLQGMTKEEDRVMAEVWNKDL